MKTKILYALLSLVIAFALWVYVVTVISPESEATYYDIPVELINKAELNNNGFMIGRNESPKVTLKLKGNRSDLNKLSKSDITLVADLSKINSTGQQNLRYSVSFPSEFPANAFEVLSYSVDQITLHVMDWSRKTLDIEVNPVGSVHPDYIIAQNGKTQDHKTITINGPKAVLDQITQARVDVDVNGKTESVSETKRVTLCNEKGEPVDASEVESENVQEVTVGIRILRVMTLPLKVTVVYGGGATAENTNVVLNYSTIKVAGTERQLELLGEELNLGTLDVSQMTGETNFETFEVDLPEGIDNLSGVTTVTATVTFPTLQTVKLTLPVSANLMYNIPDGLEVSEVGTQLCQVTFRGPKEMIEALTEADVVIRVDLTGAVVGEDLYEAQITVINPALTQIGVVSSSPILLRLAQVRAEDAP